MESRLRKERDLNRHEASLMHKNAISVQLRNALTSLGTETFSGIYPSQLHYSL